MDTPLAKERRMRAREMVTHEAASGGQRELMHEGYQMDQKFLVPDSSLRVMKELVDFKLGKPPRDRYLRDYEIIGNEKDNPYQNKLDRLETTTEESSSVSEVPEEPNTQRKIQFQDEKPTPSNEFCCISDCYSDNTFCCISDCPISDVVSGSASDTVSEVSSVKKVKKVKKMSPPPVVREIEVSPYDDRLRFLLSGHIRGNMKPIFIIHQYEGQSLFDQQIPDFRSVKKEGDVDLFVSGKFYQFSVLEEVNGVPRSLRVEPEKIIIDERSRVYEKYIKKLFSVGKVDIDMTGFFLEQANRKKYTPFLTFAINKAPNRNFRRESTESTREPYIDTGKPVVYYMAKPKIQDPFSPKPVEADKTAKKVKFERPKSAHKERKSRSPKQKRRKNSESASSQAKDDVSFDQKEQIRKNPSAKRSPRRSFDGQRISIQNKKEQTERKKSPKQKSNPKTEAEDGRISFQIKDYQTTFSVSPNQPKTPTTRPTKKGDNKDSKKLSLSKKLRKMFSNK